MTEPIRHLSEHNFQGIPVLGLVPETSVTAPATPVVGQQWTDTSINPPKVKVWNGTEWVPTDAKNISGATITGSTITGATITNPTITGVPASASTTPPASPPHGQLWLDTSTDPDVLKYYDSALGWRAVAPASDVVSKTGDSVVTGSLQVGALNVGNIMIEKSWPITIAANTPNQKIDLYAGNVESLESLVDIVVSTSVGTVSRRYSLTKQGTGIYQSGSRYNEVLGGVGDYFAIGDVNWDATNQRWRFQIVNRAVYPATIRGSINIRLYSTLAQADVLLSSFGVTDVYTTSTATLPEPILQFAGNISADSLIVSFKTVGTNYTATNLDNIIMCTAGVTITLPAPATMATGRTFRVKNLQNSAVTVQVTGGALIDGAATQTVGNNRVREFTNDGVQYRIMSGYL